MFIFSPVLLQMCKVGRNQLVVLFLPLLHSDFNLLLLKPSYPAENGLFALKNICKHKAISPQTAGKNKSVLHISRIFTFIAQISFISNKCCSHVCPLPHQVACGPFCSICSTKPAPRVTCLIPMNFFPGDDLCSAPI